MKSNTNNNQKRFRPKFHVKSGDTVMVIAGDDKGRTGEILKIDTKRGRAFVQGLNMVKRHLKPTAEEKIGRIVEKEASIHISNLKLVNPSTGLAVRTGIKIEDGVKFRYDKKTGQKID